MNRKRFVRSSAVIVSFLLLAGCSSTSPEPKPTPTKSNSSTPKPSTTPTPEIPEPTKAPVEPDPIKTTVVVIGADNLRLEKLSGEVIASYAYDTADAPVAAIEKMNELYGKTAEMEYSGEDTCWYQMNTYTWDNLKISFQTDTKDPSNSDYFIAHSEDVNENYERVVQAPNGAQISFSFAEYKAKNPELPVSETFEYEGKRYETMLGEVSALYPAEYQNGVMVSATNDRIDKLYAPGSLVGDC